MDNTMDANEFITKLKANDTAKDLSDLVKVYDEYKVILGQITPKDRAPFSLNVLCILCRNLDKAPKWRDSIDNKALLTLSIECVRETRAMERADRVKTLACIYHIHRHVVKQNSPVPPELFLKISFMPFEVDSKHLLKEYSKTYWNILVDRLSYIEELRFKIPIIKLLPKITEDALKIIGIYNTVQFCSNLIVFLVKKLHFLYTEKHAKDLNQTFRQIFAQLSSKETKPFKNLTDKEVMEIYVKLNECLYIIAENSSKTAFKDSPLDNVVRTCIAIVGHCPDLFHCLQTFYTNSFCSILTPNTHLTYTETVLNSLLASFVTTEKLGYITNAMIATYPFLNQFLRLYIEFNVGNCTKKPWKDHFNLQIQEICLKIMQVLIKRLRNCNQLLKCENCPVKSGLHDSLRLLFLTKHFITVSLSQNILITDLLPTLLDTISIQYTILTELNSLGCVNYEKCFRKLQTDVHNTAISLNKAQYYEFSIKLFDIYLKYELDQPETEKKNISRALYNKSICELDSKLFESAVIDAYLSLVFSNDGLSSDKYMSLVMDIKAKELKSKAEDDETDTERLQMISVINACHMALEMKLYGNMQPFLTDLKYTELLKHEFAMYAKLWPSVTPIGGVWKSLFDLSEGRYEFTAENAQAIEALYEVVIKTPSVVRGISSEHLNGVLTDLLERLHEKSLTSDLMIIHASLLFLKAEFELAAASQKYGWKFTEPMQNLDPDQIPANRTIPQEYAASKLAIQAVRILAEISPEFTAFNKTSLQHSLQIYQVFVQQLLHLSRDVEASQLAYICCLIADCVGDNEAYVRNAGTLLYHGTASDTLQSIITLAAGKCKGLAENTSILFICDASIYHSRCGSVGLAAKLVQLAQTRILAAYESNPEINLELSVGRLMESQIELCKDSGPSMLSAVNGAQRHYLSIANTGSKWSSRRLQSLTLRVLWARASLQAARAARELRAWRRARAAAAPALPTAAAAARAALYAQITDDNCCDDAQIKIDNRLKHVLGLQPSNETQPYYVATEAKTLEPFSPKQEIEIMLQNMVFRKAQTSPSIPCTSVPAFKTPDFFHHQPKCGCYACEIPACYILACQTSGLEASMYFRANENDIARNYFNGVIKMFHLVEERLKFVKNKWVKVYEPFIVESGMKNYMDRYKKVKVGILIDLSFFELRNENYEVANEHIVEIHEVLQDLGTVNQYTSNEIMNLMTCSAQLRKIIKQPEETGLEAEFESLKLTPVKYEEPPRTPITKPLKPPKAATKMIVKDEELPKKRKVIKLNLDDGSSDEKEIKKETKRHEFKVPVPVTSKHIFEAATPRPKTKPTILITQPSEDSNTNTKTPDIITPKNSTPDQFFTPMTSMKTYTRQKSLRRNVVKNLEQEFSTPKETANISTPQQKTSTKATLDKENLKEGNSLNLPRRAKSKEVKTNLKRVTSPGKLCKEQRELPRRTRRLRTPVNFSLDEDDKR